MKIELLIPEIVITGLVVYVLVAECNGVHL